MQKSNDSESLKKDLFNSLKLAQTKASYSSSQLENIEDAA